jgi:hypothetical protein
MVKLDRPVYLFKKKSQDCQFINVNLYLNLRFRYERPLLAESGRSADVERIAQDYFLDSASKLR